MLRLLPETVEEDGHFLVSNSYLSDESLTKASGRRDLSKVVELEITIDAEETMVGEFGRRLPNLAHLKLNGSNMPTIRSLGTSLCHLRVLWLNRSNVRCLAGISSMESLEELYVAFNSISDVSHAAGLPNLSLLDLEGNLIETEEDLQVLGQCPKLTALTLEGNPVSSGIRQKDYFAAVRRHIPGLLYLDDADLLESIGSSDERTPKDCKLDEDSMPDHAAPLGFSEKSPEMSCSGSPTQCYEKPNGGRGRTTTPNSFTTVTSQQGMSSAVSRGTSSSPNSSSFACTSREGCPAMEDICGIMDQTWEACEQEGKKMVHLIGEMKAELTRKTEAERHSDTARQRWKRERDLVQESIKRTNSALSACTEANSGYKTRPSSAYPRPNTSAYRPGSVQAVKPSCRPSSAGPFHHMAHHDSSTKGSSPLTHGGASVFCGNVTKSLRTRKLDGCSFEPETSSNDLSRASSTLAQLLDTHGDDAVLDTIIADKLTHMQGGTTSPAQLDTFVSGFATCDSLSLQDFTPVESDL
ncbi:putative U2 small nuclear ribonucleoprotein Aprime [Diplonema papillatum]|nr:putative U2 small nuclear ribonucleoprotein Aprime [Diplonema papillatum]